MPARLSGLKIFRPGVEICLKIGLALVMVVVVILPLAWGYRQHAEAELWRDVACAYRLKEAVRERLISQAALGGGRPCERLDDLGLRFDRPVAWPSASVSE
jgi:hypothetical protein